VLLSAHLSICCVDKLVLISLVPPVALLLVALIPLGILTIQNRFDLSGIRRLILCV
jgi:hypothetical protein